MIFHDSDIVIDLLRQFPPAIGWFDALDEEEEIVLSGFVVMELIQGCKNKLEQEKLQKELSIYEIVWPSQNSCNEALNIFTQYYLSHNVGLLDVLIGQTAVDLGVPLYTFNQKYYLVVPHLQTIQPYQKTGTMPVDNMIVASSTSS
ncbi:MAG: PIN domain-containing protein [Pseudomonadota bacterium]